MRLARLIPVVAAMLLLAGCSWVIQWLWPSSYRGTPPEALKTPRIISGADRCDRKLIYEESEETLGTVSDLRLDWPYAPEQKALAIVGNLGARFLAADRRVQMSVDFQRRIYGPMEMVRLNSSGEYGYLNRDQSWASDVMLFNSRGKLLWAYEGATGVDDSAAGDVDGDGKVEVGVGLNGDGGVLLVSFDGRKIGSQPDGKVWHVEMTDTNGDGKLEIIHSNAQGKITVRDSTGKVLLSKGLETYVANFGITSWGNEGSRAIVAIDEGAIYVFSLEGEKKARFGAPLADRYADVKGTVLRSQGKAKLFATLLNNRTWDRALLFIHELEGPLIYQEIIGENCGAILALPNENADRLLVGCQGRVFEYALLDRPDRPAKGAAKSKAAH